ncbi:MAG TPA: glycosyltransferase family 39 protein [Candidatus Acidoferrales bacterium]|nr:glycosyltransferase family 39 protein [Candidatus Acidoferrales bacterium]
MQTAATTAQNRPQSALNSLRRRKRACFWMVIVALAVRLAVMAFVYPAALNPARDHWRFGGEAGRIARSVAQGQGYSSPYFANTGPTAWLAPVFPLVLAGVFKTFGVYTKASALAILSLDCLLSALTCIPVFLIARRTFDAPSGERAALWAGWIWAFFPYSINFATSFIWDTTLSTLLMALLFLLALKLENAPQWKWWFGFGALAGVAALSDPVILSVAPFLTLWLLYRYWRRGQRWFAPGAMALLGVIIVLSPWFVRNYRTFHKFIPLRTDLGVEFYCGNNSASASWDTDLRPPGYHPSDSAKEWSEYREMGELKYDALKGREAWAFIRTHKTLYALQVVRRIVYVWTGFWSFTRKYLQQEPFDPGNIVFCTAFSVLAFWGLWLAWREGGAQRGMPYVIAFAVFPLMYYLTHLEEYYRRPLDPLMVALAAGAIASWRQAKRAQR